jgi:hypothetical protein
MEHMDGGECRIRRGIREGRLVVHYRGRAAARGHAKGLDAETADEAL